MKNVVIVGTGPAGLTAAIYTARAGLQPVVYAGLEHGGQLTTTTEVENFPGFANGIMGPKLMEEMTEQAKRVGAEIVHSMITKVDFSNPGHLKMWSDEKLIEARSVILSTGATAKTLGLENEDKLMGRGLSTCATCDGFFYKNKDVIVVGGGDSAMEEALYLANLCKSVTLIHRRAEFRASKIMVDRAKNHKNITIMTPYTISKLNSDPTGLTSVDLTNTENQDSQEMKIDGVFYGIGHTPNSKIFEPYVDVDDHGYIKVQDFVSTKTEGVFAAGDVADPHFKQAVTAAGMGCQAAIKAAKYIEELAASN